MKPIKKEWSHNFSALAQKMSLKSLYFDGTSIKVCLGCKPCAPECEKKYTLFHGEKGIIYLRAFDKFIWPSKSCIQLVSVPVSIL